MSPSDDEFKEYLNELNDIGLVDFSYVLCFVLFCTFAGVGHITAYQHNVRLALAFRRKIGNGDFDNVNNIN